MKSTFLDFIGDTPSTRLWDFLITGREFDYTLTDLAENAGVSWSTLHRILPNFEKNMIVVMTREIGRAKLYKLNQENVQVKKMVALYDSLLKEQLAQSKEKLVQIASARH